VKNVAWNSRELITVCMLGSVQLVASLLETAHPPSKPKTTTRIRRHTTQQLPLAVQESPRCGPCLSFSKASRPQSLVRPSVLLPSLTVKCRAPLALLAGRPWQAGRARAAPDNCYAGNRYLYGDISSSTMDVGGVRLHPQTRCTSLRLRSRLPARCQPAPPCMLLHIPEITATECDALPRPTVSSSLTPYASCSGWPACLPCLACPPPAWQQPWVCVWVWVWA